jgi:hypothetical protein
LGFRVHIHETADTATAEGFWISTTGARPAQFHRTVLNGTTPRPSGRTWAPTTTAA